MMMGLALLLAAPVLAQVNLLEDLDEWSANVDRPPTEATLVDAGPVLAAEVIADGEQETHPKLRRVFDPPQDWTRFSRLRSRVRVTCDDPRARAKRIAFVFYDHETRLPDYPGNPMRQQVIARDVPVGRWVDLRDWLVGIERATIAQLDLYIYELPPRAAHTYRWEIERLDLEQITGDLAVFDGEVHARGAMRGAVTEPAGSVATDDGLELVVGRAGEVLRVTDAGRGLGSAYTGAPGGVLLRDAAGDEPPVMAGGEITRDGEEVRQSARIDGLDLALEATYRSRGPYLEISGVVSDLRSEDRAVTVYFAIPTADAPWQWWDSVAQARTDPDVRGELAYLETNMGWGQGGAHSKYPLGAVTWPGNGGLTLAVRMDEPVVHRIVYNPGLRVFFVALDFGLVPEVRLDGRPLWEAPFRVLLYRHDPAWGFRAALQSYYDFFPDFFTDRVPEHGGWYVWGNVADTPGAVEAGFRFHWGPQAPEAVRFANEHGLLALNYIEPELFQLTMGDYDRAPTREEVLTRLRRLAEGDPEVTAHVAELAYARGGSGNIAGVGMNLWRRERTVPEYTRALAESSLASVAYGPDGEPACGIGQYSWIGDSRWGAILPSNLAPDIPGGRGRFNLDTTLALSLQGWEAAGVRCDGIALDSLGGYGHLGRANFRREHFRYSEAPLSFATVGKQPVHVTFFGTLEWLRELSEDMRAQGRFLMANCSWHITPGWLTFAAPYLDIFGAEAPRFADPDFIRAIAFRKACTDLPYEPQDDWEVPWHLLHGIFPGHGHDMEAMTRYYPLLQELSRAGWEPLTGARVSPETVRVERFGRGDRVHLALHNGGEEETRAEVALDEALLGAGPWTALLRPDDEAVQVPEGRLEVTLEGRGTVMVTLSK